MVDLAAVRALRAAGQHEQAREQLVALAAQHPGDGLLQYEAACVHDFLGLERAAIPFYTSAIQLGLPAEELRGAFLGLGSTYRTLGMYDDARATLMAGVERFPDATELRVFLAMARYNLGEYHAAVAALLQVIAETSSHAETQAYRRAILLYAENLDRVWE